MKRSLRFFLMLCLGAGCTRSEQYRRDQNPVDDVEPSYYSDSRSRSEQDNANRLEKLKGPKKKVLILDFWNDTLIGDEKLGAFAAGELRREASLRKKLILPEQNTVASTTRDFVDGDRVQTSQLIREGRRFGVSSIVLGRLAKISFRQSREEVGILRQAETVVIADIEMKVFDVGSGREVSSFKRTGTATNSARVVFDQDQMASKEARADMAQDALHNAVMKLAPDLYASIEKMDWQGRIAKIVGNKVYINAGHASGILAGDILKVLAPGEEIIDPITKAFLGRSEGLLKGTLEVSRFMGTDSSMATIHTGGNFQEGDIVKLY